MSDVQGSKPNLNQHTFFVRILQIKFGEIQSHRYEDLTITQVVKNAV